MSWRYYAQRAITNDWLDRDVDIRGVELGWGLSTPGTMTGTADAYTAGIIAADARPLFDKWSTLLYAEEDNELKWGGIVDGVNDVENGEITFTARSFSGYPKGRTYLNDYYKFYETDAHNLITMLWTLCQEDPHGNLGVAVTGDPSGYIVGSEDPGQMPVRGVGESNQDWNARLTTYLARTNDPYELAWWLTLDFGNEIDKIIGISGSDYVETHKWNDNRTQVNHCINLYGAIAGGAGARRHDLRFSEAVNVLAAPLPQDTGDSYANFVVSLGAGEERHMLRAEASVVDGRLRRDLVLPGKDIYSPRILNQTAQLGLALAQSDITYDTIEVIDHPNAPTGSWNLGDEVYVETFTNYRDINDWVRIVAWKYNPDGNGVSTLTVQRLTV